MPDLNIDFMNGQAAQGDVAQFLQTNGKLDPSMMRPYVGADGKVYVTVFKGGDAKKKENYKTMHVNTTGTLRRDEWKLLDEALITIAEHRLQGTQDLINRGLVFNLGNAMGTTVLEWHDVGDALDADLTMDGITRAQNDRPEYTTHYLPIPIIHADFEINARVLAASRNLGNALDTTMVERAGRKVAEKLEKMLFTNTTYSFGGGTIRSLVNHTSREQMAIGTNWTALSDDSTGSVGEKIVAQVLAAKQASIENNFYGPWVLYIPTGYETLIDKDYNSYKNNTIRQRILDIAGIQAVAVVDTLAANNVLLVQTTSDVVRIVRGMGLQTVQWQQEGNMITKFKVMTIQVPQVRGNPNGKCGIVHIA